MKEEMLKKIAEKTRFHITDEEMPALVADYEIFMQYVDILEDIDTSDVEILAYPYEIETTFLREDEATDSITLKEALQNAKDVENNQVKVPKVVG